ncbi:MAG: hypothetical protein IJ399_03235 [Bacilli bacterium]|nr:hypothetical protein [Bacilli bacterium]
MKKKVFSKEVLKLYKKQIPLLEKLLMPLVRNLTITNLDGIYNYNHLPESKMRLFCAVVDYKRNFFDTEEELIDFIKNSDIRVDDIYILDYLDEVYNRDRVIKVTFMNGHEMLYSKVDEYGWNGFAIHDPHKSFSSNKYIWNYYGTSIDDIYLAFIDRGLKIDCAKLRIVK